MTGGHAEAELSSCSFFALTDDDTLIGPAPLRVRFFSIKASVGDINAPEYASGSVSFTLDFGDGNSYETTAPMTGYAAQADDTYHTYQEPGTYATTLTATHTSGSTVKSESITICVEGGTSGDSDAGGDTSRDSNTDNSDASPGTSDITQPARPVVTVVALVIGTASLIAASLPSAQSGIWGGPPKGPHGPTIQRPTHPRPPQSATPPSVPSGNVNPPPVPTGTTGPPASWPGPGGTPISGPGVQQGPPDTAPPPTPPYGQEFPPDRTPRCPICQNHTIPDNNTRPPQGRWYCPNCPRYPWP